MTTRHLGLTWIGLAFVLLSLSACAPVYAGRQSFLRATGNYAGVTFTFDCRPGDGGRLDLRNEIFFQCESTDPDRRAILSVISTKTKIPVDETLRFGLSVRTGRDANPVSLGLSEGLLHRVSRDEVFSFIRLESSFQVAWPSGASVKGQFLLVSD